MCEAMCYLASLLISLRGLALDSPRIPIHEIREFHGKWHSQLLRPTQRVVQLT